MNHHIQLETHLGSLALNVSVSFGNEIIIISGENGAGKSTLLRCIAGLQEAHGQLHINQHIWLDSSAYFVLPTEKRKLGFVFSEAVLLPWLSVEKNITLGMAEMDNAWFKQLSEQLEISSFLKRKPATLSSGEAQRVSLVRAIYRKPNILLLDEPFSAQAPNIHARLRFVLQDLQQQLNIPILLVSHDLDDTKILAKQHWCMREGKLMMPIKCHSREDDNPKKRVNHE